MSLPRAALAVDIFTALVIMSVALALAGLSWRLLGETGAPAPTALAAGPPPPPPDIAPVLAFAPFGRVSVAHAPATGLGIQLRGIVMASPGSASIVLISAAGGPARPFTVGQSPAGGGVIEEIALDHVLLRVNGRIEMLAFPKATTTPADGSAAPVVAAVSPVASAPPPPVAQSLLEGLGASPSHAGYVVGNPSTAMRRAGLQRGDVIEKINGVMVGNVEHDRQLLASSALSGAARVDLLRDGKRITFAIPLR